MTPHLSSIFRKSLLATSIALGLSACGGGGGLDAAPVDPGAGGCTENCSPSTPTPQPPPTSSTSVRDFGGLNGKIVWDANRDWFVVGTDDKLYAYNIQSGRPDPDSDLVPLDRLAQVKGITVTDDDAIIRNGEAIGSIAADQTAGGELFYVMAYGSGTEQGYLNIDFNRNYRGRAEDDKTDARIDQFRSVAVQKSFQGLLGNTLWSTPGGNLAEGTNIESLLATDTDLNFSFVPTASGNYHFVLREYGHPYTDLDIRLVEPESGRILASSYSTLNGELIMFPLAAGTTYGVNVSRSEGSVDTDFLLSIKQADDTEANPTLLTPLGTTKTIRGTLHPITRLEFCSRFPFPGWADASSDSTSDDIDSLFRALSDSSSDGSSDATSDIAPLKDELDSDTFQFSFTATVPFKSLTRFDYKVLNDGGNTHTSVTVNGLFGGLRFGPGSFSNYLVNKQSDVKVTFEEQFKRGDTIEYELLINKR